MNCTLCGKMVQLEKMGLLSKKELNISGMCHICQDEIFSGYYCFYCGIVTNNSEIDDITCCKKCKSIDVERMDICKSCNEHICFGIINNETKQIYGSTICPFSEFSDRTHLI
jgi:hypothetical protein